MNCQRINRQMILTNLVLSQLLNNPVKNQIVSLSLLNQTALFLVNNPVKNQIVSPSLLNQIVLFLAINNLKETMHSQIDKNLQQKEKIKLLLTLLRFSKTVNLIQKLKLKLKVIQIKKIRRLIKVLAKIKQNKALKLTQSVLKKLL